MYAIAVFRYRKPLEEALKILDEHRAYLRHLQAKGLLLASGPMDPRSGGILFLRVPDEGSAAALDAIRDGDPFIQQGCAQYELLPWLPNLGVDALDKL